MTEDEIDRWLRAHAADLAGSEAVHPKDPMVGARYFLADVAHDGSTVPEDAKGAKRFGAVHARKERRPRQNTPRGFLRTKSGWLLEVPSQSALGLQLIVTCPDVDVPLDLRGALADHTERLARRELSERINSAEHSWIPALEAALFVECCRPAEPRATPERIVSDLRARFAEFGAPIPQALTGAALRAIAGPGLGRVTPSKRGGKGRKSIAAVVATLAHSLKGDSRRSDVGDRIVHALQECPAPPGVEALRRRLRLRISTIWAGLGRLEKDGRIVEEGRPKGRPRFRLI